MTTRTRRYFGEHDKQQLINELGSWRSICVRVCTKAPVNGHVYRLADKLIFDIDNAVEGLTGNREYFRAKAHSTH